MATQNIQTVVDPEDPALRKAPNQNFPGVFQNIPTVIGNTDVFVTVQNKTENITTVYNNPSGDLYQVQFKVNGRFGGDSNFTYTPSSKTVYALNLNVGGITNLGSATNVKIGGGPTGYYLQTDGLGNLSWGPGSGAGSGELEQAVTVIGTNLGAVDAGYTFPLGMSFTDFVIAISQKTIPPTYTSPTLTMSGSPAPSNTEIGSIISIILNRVFNQNDGGSISAQRLYKNAVLLSTTFPYTDTGVQLTASNIVYQTEVDYNQGPVKNNNMGMPDPSGQIPAGTVTSGTVTYVGKRKGFYGTPASTPASSAAVRAMANSTFSIENNPDVSATGVDLVADPVPNFTITIPIGATRVTFAYPDTSRAVASVRYEEFAYSEVKGNFTQTTVSVEGANGYTPVNYRVYTYVPVEAFSQEVNYQVFI